MLIGMFGRGKKKEPEKTSYLVYQWQPGTPYLGPRAGPGEEKYLKSQAGGTVPGSGSGDIIPAMLEPGEFVVNRGTVEMFGPRFFYELQALAKYGVSGFGGLGGAMNTLKMYGGRSHFQGGGFVPSGGADEMKITVVNVVDEKSLEEFLNTKKYGNVIVNRVGPRIIRRRSSGGFYA